jgi:hypothetical protein
MPLTRWSLTNGEGKKRDVRSRLDLVDRGGTLVGFPKPPPYYDPNDTGATEAVLTAPDGSTVTWDADPKFLWSGVRVQVQVWGFAVGKFPGSTVWSAVFPSPRPLPDPSKPDMPDVERVEIVIGRGLAANDRLLVTVRMWDPTGKMDQFGTPVEIQLK